MIIGYARVSTQHQNTDRQADELQAAGCEKLYVDKISSRKDFEARKEWGRMWDALRPGDVLVVTELDRIGRSLRDLLDIVRELETRGVTLRLLRGMFSGQLAGPDATPAEMLNQNLLLSVGAAFAEYERAIIRERTREGLAAARARGRTGGRKEAHPPLARQMIASLYHAKQVPVQEIAAQYGINRNTVRRYAAEFPPAPNGLERG